MVLRVLWVQWEMKGSEEYVEMLDLLGLQDRQERQ